jgi:hypothetical protein
MSEETKSEAVIPKNYRWKSLTSLEGVELLQHYREMLVKLGEAKNPSVQAIFANAQTSLRQPRHLTRWFLTLTRSIGIPRAMKASVISTKACWKKTPVKPNPVPANTSRRAPSSTPWSQS